MKLPSIEGKTLDEIGEDLNHYEREMMEKRWLDNQPRRLELKIDRIERMVYDIRGFAIFIFFFSIFLVFKEVG